MIRCFVYGDVCVRPFDLTVNYSCLTQKLLTNCCYNQYNKYIQQKMITMSIFRTPILTNKINVLVLFIFTSNWRWQIFFWFKIYLIYLREKEMWHLDYYYNFDYLILLTIDYFSVHKFSHFVYLNCWSFKLLFCFPHVHVYICDAKMNSSAHMSLMFMITSQFNNKCDMQLQHFVNKLSFLCCFRICCSSWISTPREIC